MSNHVSNPMDSAAELLEKIKGVDGSGSGLDADTLDGMHESSIFRCIKYGYLDMPSDDYAEWCKIPSGMYSFAKSHTPGSECPIVWGYLLHFAYAVSEGQVNIVQFVVDMFGGAAVYRRTGYNGSWTQNWTQFAGGVILRLLDLASERRRTA